ncbi:MAG: helix-hairpin-helix domain-containing protein, partial [Acidimicrobiia bacterium]
IEDSKSRGLSRVLVALGIRHVGPPTAQLLAQEFGALDSIMNAPEEKLVEIEGVGPIVARAIAEWFSSARNRRIVERLEKGGVVLTESRVQTQGPLTGSTFVITGTLPRLSREEAAALIEKAGGKVSSSVSKKTSYLLLGENPGSKLSKAQELGVEQISEERLLQLIG